MRVNEDQFQTYEKEHNPPEHRCAELLMTETSKDYKIRIFNIPIPHENTFQEQPHIVISHKSDGNLCGNNIDFCPYCGADLANWLRERVQEKTIESKPVEREYFAYRKRFVQSRQSGKEIAPMRESKWATTVKTFEDTVRMLNKAQEQFKPQLIEDLKEMITILCLSEDYLRNYQLPDEVTPNPNDTV